MTEKIPFKLLLALSAGIVLGACDDQAGKTVVDGKPRVVATTTMVADLVRAVAARCPDQRIATIDQDATIHESHKREALAHYEAAADAGLADARFNLGARARPLRPVPQERVL